MKNSKILIGLFLAVFIFIGCPIDEEDSPGVVKPPVTPSSYKIYSNGEWVSGTSRQNWQSGWNYNSKEFLDDNFIEPGHSTGSFNVIRMNLDNSPNWWLGWGVFTNNLNAVNLSNINALSYWVKNPGSEEITISATGFGATSNYQVEYNGENPFLDGVAESGIKVPADGEWHRVIVPVPVKKDVDIINVFYICSADVHNKKILYIDDIEFLNMNDLVLNSIIIPPDGTFSYNETGLDPVWLSAKMIFKQGSNTITLINNHSNNEKTKFYEWAQYVYSNLNGATAGANGLLNTGSANGSFSLKLKIGTVESNTMTADIEDVVLPFVIYSNGTWALPSSERWIEEWSTWTGTWFQDRFAVPEGQGHSGNMVIQVSYTGNATGWTGWAVTYPNNALTVKNKYNALSFWVKNTHASNALTFTNISYGSSAVRDGTALYHVSYRGETKTSNSVVGGVTIPANSGWVNVIVPIPNNKIDTPDEARKTLFHVGTDNRGSQLMWFDDIEFVYIPELVLDRIELPSIPSVAGALTNGTQFDMAKFVWKLGEKEITLFPDSRSGNDLNLNKLHKWVDEIITTSTSGTVTFDNQGRITASNNATHTIQFRVGNVLSNKVEFIRGTP